LTGELCYNIKYSADEPELPYQPPAGCQSASKRDETQEKALSWAREVSADQTVQEMIRCGEIMKGQIPYIPFMGLEEDYSNRHACDME
jgi:hypothetical protein